MATIRNGQLPTAMLGTIGNTQHYLLRELVPQTNAMRNAFQARFGKLLNITDAYRTLEEQYALKASKGSYAATPGFSVHGWGKALDLGSGVNLSFTSPEHLWMRENGPKYGWVHPAWAHNHYPGDGEDEPWHFEGHLVTNYPGAGSPVPTEEDDMYTDEDRAQAGRTDVKAQTAIQAADNATNAANAATAAANAATEAARAAVAEAKATHADLITGINELRALARALGH